MVKKYLTVSFCLIASIVSGKVVSETQTAVVNIQANVVATCEAGSNLVGTNQVSFGTLNFGYTANLDQNLAISGQPHNGAIRIKCTNNTAYKVFIDAGLHSQSTTTRYLSNGNSKVSYNLFTDSSHTSVWDDVNGLSGISNGQETWLPIYALIFQQTTPEMGIYTDTVNITISY